MAKITSIEWVKPTRDFKCPCCSAEALNSDGNLASQTCPHFLFSWGGIRQDCVDFNSEVEVVMDDSSLAIDGPLNSRLLGSIPAASQVYVITIRDEALGPIIRTDVIAFAPLAA